MACCQGVAEREQGFVYCCGAGINVSARARWRWDGRAVEWMGVWGGDLFVGRARDETDAGSLGT